MGGYPCAFVVAVYMDLLHNEVLYMLLRSCFISWLLPPCHLGMLIHVVCLF